MFSIDWSILWKQNIVHYPGYAKLLRKIMFTFRANVCKDNCGFSNLKVFQKNYLNHFFLILKMHFGTYL